MHRLFIAAALAASLGLAACSSTQEVYEITEVDRPAEYASDSLAFEARQARITYVRPAQVTPDVAPDRQYDLLNTALDLSFDFEDEAVIGTVRHTLTPIGDDLARFYFHAEAMEIESVRQVVDGRDVGVGFEAGASMRSR